MGVRDCDLCGMIGAAEVEDGAAAVCDRCERRVAEDTLQALDSMETSFDSNDWSWR